MRFRNKLLLMMVGLAVASNGVLVAVTTLRSRALLMEEIRSKVLSIAATAARMVDAQAHESILAESDVDGDAYTGLESLLRAVRDANRRDDVEVKFVYTLRPVEGRPGVYVYVVDAEERGSPDKSQVLEEHKPSDPSQATFPVDRDDVQIGTDAYGTFLSATSPIRDRDGVPRALVGVDVVIEEVLSRTRRLLYIGLGGMAMAGGVAALFAVYLSRRVSYALESLMAAVERVAAGDLEAKAPLTGGDEFARVGAAFNEMVPQLRDGLKIKESLALAMEVQQALLPSTPPVVDGIEISGRSIYCDETGGDYFDFLELSDVTPDTLAVAVGDVTGHGIAAALLMTTARALLRGHAGQGGSLAQVVTHMNRHLSSDCQAGRFMTMFYLVLNSTTRDLRWVSAGHDPAIAYNPSTDVFVELAGADIPMGLDADWEYQEFQREGWIDGHVIVIGTDGIWESRDPQGRMFGKTGLREVIRSHARRPCADIARAITDTLLKYRQGRSQEDDVTLVVIKFVPRSSAPGIEHPGDLAAPGRDLDANSQNPESQNPDSQDPAEPRRPADGGT